MAQRMENIPVENPSLLTEDAESPSEDEISEKSFLNIEYDLAQNIVRLTSVPLLEQIALTQFVISLWQQEDIRNEIARYDFFKKLRTNEWLPVNEKVIKKIDHLSLNIYFKNEILKKIKQIGEEIFFFLFYENERQYGSISDGMDFNKKLIYMDHIHWNMEGTINKVKTVSNIIDKTNLETLDKYILACNYCLEGKIRFLLKKLPKNFPKIYFDIPIETAEWYRYILVYFWTRRIKRKKTFIECRSYLHECTEFAEIFVNYNGRFMSWAIRNVHEAAVSFIWENLKLARWGTKEQYCYYLFFEDLFVANNGSLNIICYLLTVDNWHYDGFTEDRAVSLLRFLISDYRWVRHLFFRAVEYLLYELEAISYSDVLVVMIKYGDFEDNFVKFLYSEILALYPCDFSWCDTLIKENNLAWYVINREDKDIANFVLNMLSPAEKKKFIYSEPAINAFTEAFWDWVQFSWLDSLVQDIIRSEQQIKDFKKYVTVKIGIGKKNRHFSQILQWINCDEEELDRYEKLDQYDLGPNSVEYWVNKLH